MRRVLERMLLLTCLVSASTQSIAMDLTWSNGNRNLNFERSVQCTLVIAMGEGETQPVEWRLVWVAEAPPGVDVATGNATGEGLCNVPLRTTSDVISHLQVLEFCSGSGARIALTLSEPVRARFRLFRVDDTGLAQGTPPEVTLNGGVKVRDPPIVVSVRHDRIGDSLAVVVAGQGLDEVVRADYVSATEAWRVPLPILARSTNTLALGGPMPHVLGPGSIEVANADGWLARGEFSGEPLAGKPSYPPDRFIVRFRPGEVKGGISESGQDIEGIGFKTEGLKALLRSADVTALLPVFPWFKPTDVFTTNTIGEKQARPGRLLRARVN